MAKEVFHIIAQRWCDESYFEEKRAGVINESDPYSWIEGAFEIVLVRQGEATHICSFEASSYYVFLQNVFVGVPNAAWEYNADPDGLECDSGGVDHDYMGYQDKWNPAFICETFTIDTMKDLDGLRKPGVRNTLSRRTEKDRAALDSYDRAIWEAAEEAAHGCGQNGGFWADGLNIEKFRADNLAAELRAIELQNEREARDNFRRATFHHNQAITL